MYEALLFYASRSAFPLLCRSALSLPLSCGYRVLEGHRACDDCMHPREEPSSSAKVPGVSLHQSLCVRAWLPGALLLHATDLKHSEALPVSADASINSDADALLLQARRDAKALRVVLALSTLQEIEEPMLQSDTDGIIGGTDSISPAIQLAPTSINQVRLLFCPQLGA